MRVFRVSTVAWLVSIISVSGCGSGPEGEPSAPAPAVLATLEVTPANPTIFSRPPENTVLLAAIARDQYGARVNGAVEYSTANSSVATISGSSVIAAGAGTVQITASITSGGITKTGTTAVTVVDAESAGNVTAPAFSFLPAIVDIAAGGVVTWTIGAIHHNVAFGSAGAPADVPELINASASRTFATPGVFTYACTFHQGMTGTVRVH